MSRLPLATMDRDSFREQTFLGPLYFFFSWSPGFGNSLYPATRRTRFQCPEHYLLIAVLHQAYKDLLTCQQKGPKATVDNSTPAGTLALTARQWFFSKKTDPFSYLHLCEHLDIDAEHYRAILEQRGLL